MIIRLLIVFLLTSCEASQPKAGVAEPTPTPTDETKDEPRTDSLNPNKPLDFSASVSGLDGAPLSLKVGSPLSCEGETSASSGTAISYKVRWTARWRESLTSLWKERDVTGELSGASAVVPPSIAHLEISCVKIALSSSGDETESLPAPFLKVINTDPAPFVADAKGLRQNGSSNPSGIAGATQSFYVLTGDVLTCSGTTADQDLDALSFSTVWEYQASGTDGWEIAGSGDRHRVPKDRAGSKFRCSVSAYDVAGGITVALSPEAVVGNRSPDEFFSIVKYFSFGFYWDAPPEKEFTAGDAVSCDAAASDLDQTSAPEMSYAWRAYGGQADDYVEVSRAKDYVVAADASHRYLTCVATAKDSQGATRDSLSLRRLVKNSRPKSFQARVEGLPRIGEDLSCNASAVDPDGDPLSYAYTWMISPDGLSPGYVDESMTGAVITVTPDLSNKNIRCAVRAVDPSGAETTSVPSVWTAITNSPPKVSKADVSPSLGDRASVGGALSCSAIVTDADQNPLTVSYLWQKSATLGGGFATITKGDAGESLAAADRYEAAKNKEIFITPALAHQYVRCIVSATDGLSYLQTGEPSDVVEILNGKPDESIFLVSTIPNATDPDNLKRVLKVGSLFTCNASTTDIDQDTITYSRTRRIQRLHADGTPSSGKIDIRSLLGFTAPSPGEPSMVIPQSLAHSTVDCRVTADDGHGGVIDTDFSTPVLIDNTPPVPFEGSLPDTLYVGDEIFCDATTTDLDGDALQMTSRWIIKKKSGEVLTGVVGEDGPLWDSSFIIARDSVGDEISCVRTAKDGWGGETTFTYKSRMIENSKPVSFEAMLSSSSAPAETRVGDRLTCFGATYDPDDLIGAPRLTYRSRFVSSGGGAESETLAGSAWTANSSELTGGLHVASHLVTTDDAHKLIACEIVATDDGGAETVSRMSRPVQVQNTPPEAFVTTALPNDGVLVGSTISCGGDRAPADKDLDQVTVSYDWYKANSQISSEASYTKIFGLNEATITVPSYFGHGMIRCVATARDGHGGETSGGESPGIPVLNSPPEKISSKVVRVSDPEPLLTGLTTTQYGYDSTVSCEENGPRFDRDMDEVVIDAYVWGYRDGDGSFKAEPALGRGRTYRVTDATRLLVVHRDIACQIVARDAPEDHISWVETLTTTGDFGREAQYVNAAPAPFVTTFSLASSPSYQDALSRKTVDMAGKIAVGSVISCGALPTDPDNGGLPKGAFADIISTSFVIQKKDVRLIFGIPVSIWTDASLEVQGSTDASVDMAVPKAAAHAGIRCFGRASDAFGGVTTSDTMTEGLVQNTPPVVSAVPSPENPAVASEDGILSLPVLGTDAGPSVAWMDADGDALTWSLPGTPAGPAWAAKSRIVRSSTNGKVYDILTTANPAAGSDGYDYASLATPQTLEAAFFTASLSDGFDQSSGPIYYKVRNVDRPTVISGVKVSRTLPSGTKRIFSAGEEILLSEYRASQVNQTTGAEFGCGATPNDTPEFYSGKNYYVEGTGDMNPTLATPSLKASYQQAVASVDLELQYQDPDGDEIAISSDGTAVSYDIPARKDPAGILSRAAVTSGVSVTKTGSLTIRISVNSCDVVRHEKEFTERNVYGSVLSYPETATSTNGVTGHYRRRWSAEMKAAVSYVSPVTGETLGTAEIPLRVLDVDRVPNVRWWAAPSSNTSTFSAMSVGGDYSVSEPSTPIISWELSADPDMDEVEAHEATTYLSSTQTSFSFNSGYYVNGRLSDPTNYSFSNHVYGGIVSTKNLSSSGTTGKMPSYWKVVRDYQQSGDSRTGYRFIVSSSPTDKASIASKVYAFNLTKSTCETNTTAKPTPYVTTAIDLDDLPESDKKCVGADNGARTLDFQTALATSRTSIRTQLSAASVDEVTGGAGVTGTVQNVPRCAQYLTQLNSCSGTNYWMGLPYNVIPRNIYWVDVSCPPFLDFTGTAPWTRQRFYSDNCSPSQQVFCSGGVLHSCSYASWGCITSSPAGDKLSIESPSYSQVCTRWE